MWTNDRERQMSKPEVQGQVRLCLELEGVSVGQGAGGLQGRAGQRLGAWVNVAGGRGSRGGRVQPWALRPSPCSPQMAVQSGKAALWARSASGRAGRVWSWGCELSHGPC